MICRAVIGGICIIWISWDLTGSLYYLHALLLLCGFHLSCSNISECVLLPWRSPVMSGAVEKSAHIGFIPPGDIHHQHTCNINTHTKLNMKVQKISKTHLRPYAKVSASRLFLLSCCFSPQQTDCLVQLLNLNMSGTLFCIQDVHIVVSVWEAHTPLRSISHLILSSYPAYTSRKSNQALVCERESGRVCERTSSAWHCCSSEKPVFLH